ncbi:MAG: glycosyltransferase family 2 protein, partial [Hyphomicrobiales bacterium]
RQGSLRKQPFFSIIMPTHNTPELLLEKAIHSVQQQWYPHWEFLIVDDGSEDENTIRVLKAIDDPRIRVMFQSENKGVSASSNLAIEQIQGDYAVFLEHEDELTENCLWELAVEIDHSNADFLYSDEDNIDAAGNFMQPFFKPDWSPDALMSMMYACRVSCIQVELLHLAGPLNPEYDGAQEWDLILRVTEKARKISHIPKVLYHRRMRSESAAMDAGRALRVAKLGKRLREEALVRRGLEGTLEALEIAPIYYRVNYHAQEGAKLSILIPSRDNGAILEKCVHSILNAKALEDFEIIIIDNGSEDAETLNILSRLKSIQPVRIIDHAKPFNFSQLNNVGIEHATGNYILHLNDDTEIASYDAIQRMLGYCQLPHIGAVGARLLYPGGRRIQHAGVLNLSNGPSHAFAHSMSEDIHYYLRNHLEYNWLAVTGACLMADRRKLDEIGGWDEDFPVSYNDVELCFRLHKAGYFNIVSQASELIHHESVSRGHDRASFTKRFRLRRDRVRLYKKHPDLFGHDPFFNVNLHEKGTYFQLADEERA